MGDGVTLALGLLVPLSVVEVLNHEVEPAATLLLPTAGRAVSEMQRNLRIAILAVLAKLMEDGVPSVLGLPVPLSVVEVPRRKAEPAATLLQLTVERTV